MKLLFKNNLNFICCCLFLFSALIISLLAIEGTYFSSNDIMDHNQFATMIMNGSSVNFAHQGYHWLLITLRWITQLNFELISLILLVSLSTYFAYVVFKTLYNDHLKLVSLLGCCFVVFGTAFYNLQIDRIYFGQFANVIYHNPTYIVMRVLGMLSVLYFFKLYNDDKANSKFKVGLTGLVFAYSTFVKPNFAITFLAALFLLFIYECIKGNKAKIIKIIVFTIPSAMVLWYLFFGTFGTGDAGIVILPLGYAKAVVERLRNIPLAIICPIIFPVAYIIIAKTKKLKLSLELKIALLATLMGLIQYLVFAESGDRFIHGNFAWSVASGYTLLYYYSMKDYLGQYRNLNKSNYYLLSLTSIHIVSGLYYAVMLMMGVVAWHL